MPNVNVENQPKNQIKLTITVTKEEVLPFLQEAASRLSEQSKIPGFRPGKAGYEVVKTRFGEMKIYEEALEPIVRKTFVEAVLGNNIETVGSPKIDVEKLAPGNDLIYTAIVNRMPAVTRLAEYKKLTVEAKPVVIAEKDIELTLSDLRRMQTKEVRAENGKQAAAADKVVISIGMKKEGVPVEGGQSPNHAVYLAEDYYIPGMKDQLVGMKEGESKQFTLPFPKDHVQKMLAGSEILFDVTVKEIYHLEAPALDEAFAKSLGQSDIATLKKLIESNLRKEKDEEERVRVEKEMLELVAKESRFEDIPDLLLNEEISKMTQELEHAVEEQGVEFGNYLKSIKKTLAELKLDFTPQALTRIKVALILRTLAKQENIKVETAELDKSLEDRAAKFEDPEVRKRIYAPAYREYTESLLRNRKVIDLLRSAMLKK